MKSWRSWTDWLPRTPKNNSASAPEATRDPTAERGWTLRFRLLLTVTLALLPIAVVSVLQGLTLARTDALNVHERLLESARAAAANENNMLTSAQQTLRQVASFPEVRQMSPGCNRALMNALIGANHFMNLARLDARGAVVCSALPAAKGAGAANNPLFKAAAKAEGIVVSGQLYSPIIKRAVIAAMLPLRDADNRFAGTVSIALDAHWLDLMLRVRDLPPRSVVAVFDGSGNVMASNDLDVARRVFSRGAPGGEEALLSGRDAMGYAWTYASAPLLGNSVFVGFAMPEQYLFGPAYLHLGANILWPFVMIAIAWVAIWTATDRQVTHWIDYLRRVATAYRSGHYAVRPALETAPTEFRLLADAMSDMAEAVQDRDRRLRDALEQKSVLIKEIHHRVKNNLQIVMSLLSLQAGQLRDTVARDALMQAQVRINALALVHRILHEIEDQSVVDLRRLLEELTQQVVGGLSAEGRKLTVETDILPRDVSGDLAVPLALFTVEALTNIFKHAYPGGGHMPGRIAVSLRDAGDARLRLAVEDDGVGFDSDSTGRNVGSRLIRTFGQQVGGVASIRSSQGSGTVVELMFPDPDKRAAIEKASAA